MYELNEEQGKRDGQSVQNWEPEERELRKADVKTEPKSEANNKKPTSWTPQLVKRDQAGIHGESLPLGQAISHAAAHDFIENP